MSPSFNPKYLALAGFLLATVASAADSPAGTSGKPASAPTSANEVSTSVVSFQGMQDQYTRSTWMVIQVDFTASAKAPAQFLNDVSVTLKLAWDKPGAQPPVDLVLTSTVRLIAAASGRRNTVFFFVPAETLARSSRGTPYDAGHAPNYYVVEYKVGENTLPLAHNDYSSALSLDFAKSFSTMADSNSNKGLLYSEATVPAYILTSVMTRIGSNSFPAFYPASSDAGH